MKKTPTKALVLPIEVKTRYIEGQYGFIDDVWEISANFKLDDKPFNFTHQYKKENYCKTKAKADFICQLKSHGYYQPLRAEAKTNQAKVNSI